MFTEPLALYIHIPFCETKCAYCNFNTYAKLESLVPRYMDALVAEIKVWGESLERPELRTIFFGGGTPSWIPANQLGRTLSMAQHAFRLRAGAEISAEANPGDATVERMRAWCAMGINRVSMGVQSLDDRLLTFLTRRHSAKQALQAVRNVRAAGIENLNIDLIYGLPFQSMELWRDSLQRAVALRLPHLSLYALTVEEGTPLHQRVRDSEAPAPDGDLAAEMYELAEQLLGEAGYRHYEISNWALPGKECQHNLVYWRNQPFLGVGPGAHSYLEGQRFWNLRSPQEYIKRFTEGPLKATAAVEGRASLEGAELVSETLILQLRLDDGLDARVAVRQFGQEAVAPHVKTLRTLVEQGLLTEEKDLFHLTSKGRLLSNEVFVRLLAE